MPHEKNKRCNGHRLQLEPAAKRKEKQKVQQLATCNRRSRTANSTGPQVRRHRRQGLLWPQLEPDKRTKAQWLATCSRRTRTASSTGWWLFNVHPLHPFERRSAVTPILGGLQLRSSKRHRQLKTAKQKPRKQTKSQGGGNLSRKKSGQGCPRDFAHPRGRIFRLLRTALVPSKPKVQSAHSKSSSSSSRTTVSGVSRRHQWGDQSPKLPGSTCKSSSWS